MKIIFAGTPVFAEIALEALLHSSHDIVSVLTQPDKPSGRGLKLKPSAVKVLATQYQLPIFQPASLKGMYEHDLLKSFNADVMVVAAYGLLIPATILTLPRHGCINIHPSLLPRWRGAAPIQRTIYAGDTISGVSIMQMDAGLDTGPILYQQSLALHGDETSVSLHDQLARLGATALIKTLDLISNEAIRAKPQDNSLATYAHKISKEEALIDWEEPGEVLEREIRAFNPWPIAYTTWRGESLRIWEAKLVENTNSDSASSLPRTIVRVAPDGIDIATGTKPLRLLKLQRPGAKLVSVTDFYNAMHDDLIVGDHFV